MRIGELAALVGVSTRTVRHYHRLGLLPEPVRLSNGYRDYRLRDAVVLARVRRLAELGLSLDEIGDVLAEDRDLELREVLMELDADLARQQATIGERRERLAALLADPDLHPDSAVSPEMAAVLRELPTGGSQFAKADREMLTLVCAMAPPEERERLLGLLRPLTEPEAVARGQALYERLDELAEASPSDPRVAPLAADLAAHIPQEMAALMIENLDSAPERLHPSGSESPPGGRPRTKTVQGSWDEGRSMEAVFDEMPPAQAEVFRLAVAAMTDRARGQHQDRPQEQDQDRNRDGEGT